MNPHLAALPYGTLLSILRKTSTFPNRPDWVSFISPEDALAILQRDDALREVAQKYFHALLTNHEESLAGIFDTGTLHARVGLNTVSSPERALMSAHPDHSDCLRALDLDFLALSNDTIKLSHKFSRSLQTLGIRHFLHDNTLAADTIGQGRGAARTVSLRE